MGVIEGIIGVLLGIAVGRLWRADARRATADQGPKPVCGCSHHHSMHDPKTGQCHGTVNGRVLQTSSYLDRPVVWDQLPCKCRQYSGPVPLPEYTAQEIVP